MKCFLPLVLLLASACATSPTAPDLSVSATDAAAAQAYFEAYVTTHQLPANYPNVEAAMNHYRGARAQGQTHQAAMEGTPAVLGWTSYVPPQARILIDRRNRRSSPVSLYGGVVVHCGAGELHRGQASGSSPIAG